MNDYGQLAYTGLGTIVVGGIVINQWWLATIAVGLILLGILVLRLGWRRGKTASDR